MEGKKISFSFMKTKKAEKPIVEDKKDFIECVEEKSIKVIGGEEIKENTPLVIPMKPNTLVTAERLKEIAEKVESALEEPEIVEEPASPQEKPPENETLDQKAVRELLQDAKKEVNVETSVLTVPLPAKPVNEGEKESTLDDYETVPIQDFGLAMLRGMGWAPNKDQSTYKQPQLRPKGLGLGADKVVKSNQKQKPATDSKGEELTIMKNSYVKITTGKHSGYYGKIVSLDEDTGRAMVDIAVKKEMVSLSEFMMQPVNKSEYDKESKVINAGSYEQFKKKELKKSSRSAVGDTPERSNEDRNKYSEKAATSSRSGDNRDEKPPRNVEGKYERDEKSSRSVEYKYERDEKSSRDTQSKYDREEKSSRDTQSKYDREEKSSRDTQSKYDRDEKSSRDAQSKYDRDEKSSRKLERKYDKDEKSTKNVETDKSSKNGKEYKDDDRRERDRDRAHRKERRDSTEERCSRKKNKRYSSSESLDSLSDTERKSKKKDKPQNSEDSSSESDRDTKKKSKKKDKRRHDSNDSESDHRSKRNKTPEGKRDIDKKRKGKKKKRDRDRSPNYRKHRK